MFEYITKAQLRKFASQLPLNEQASLRRSAASRILSGSTFLSHSSKDEDLVVGATRVLEGHGGKVYIDEVDPNMPPYTTAHTAEVLKGRIKQSKRFVLLASANSKDSRWVPWELGIADGYRGIDSIALFPATEGSNEKGWASWEYLGLYRRIVWGDMEGVDKSLWMVLDEKKNTAIALSEWLAS